MGRGSGGGGCGGRRANGMLVTEAVRGSGKEMGSGGGTKPKAPGLN